MTMVEVGCVSKSYRRKEGLVNGHRELLSTVVDVGAKDVKGVKKVTASALRLSRMHVMKVKK
jgi:hypothetical protein